MIVVNESTGAPSISGTVGSYTQEPGSTGNADHEPKWVSDDYFQIRIQGGGVNVWKGFWYNPASGWTVGSITEAIFNAAEFRVDYYQQDVNNQWSIRNAANTRLYISNSSPDNHSKVLVYQTDSTTRLIDSTTVVTHDLSSDYIKHGLIEFLDATHFLQYYGYTSASDYKIKTFSLAADGSTFSLIDTFIAPVSFGRFRQAAKRNSKNLILTEGTPADGQLTSVELHTDWTILGTNVATLLYNVLDYCAPRYSGTGDVYNIYNKSALNVYSWIPYTVNAYKTTPFTYAGVATATASSGTTPISVAGVSSGHSSLTIGTSYYISDAYDGTLTIDDTLGIGRVGKAISATEIVLGEIL
jgi:hypothetical protein